MIVQKQGEGGRRKVVADLRARAGRVRKHAQSLSGDPASPKLEKLADELDATAQALETEPAAHAEQGKQHQTY